MSALNLILQEVEQLHDDELHVLLHAIVDKLHIPATHPKTSATNPFAVYRGRAAGVWNQDAQAYVNDLRHEERF